MTIKRIGFCCKLIDNPSQLDGIKATDLCKKYNTGSTTVAWLGRQTRSAAEDKLWSLVKSNIESIRLLVEKVGSFEPNLRMVRLSSDILPVYTHPDWSYFYLQSDVVSYMERQFARVGELARSKDVRLSFHPGQYTVIASENDNIVERSIEEFEYHADMIRWMGYGQKFQDFKCNVHIAGKRGPAGMIAAYSRLSPEARNSITIENEENSWGLDACLSISDTIPVVLDLHHNWCREGEYIEVRDQRVAKVIDSWRGVRPVLHYSQSREDYLDPKEFPSRPNMAMLLESGYKKAHLRAHSDFYWNEDCNLWALEFLEHFDIMSECKSKNLGSRKLASLAASLGLF